MNRRKQNSYKNTESSEITAGRVRTSARQKQELDRSFQASYARQENVIDTAPHDEIGISFEQARQHLCQK